ncbi:negative elongation factor E [Chelonus insularis]|uniref:negative elongation factor E n=1 Tax=Chelonus insularis TaxID=460826 RepID=UPI0015892AF4|nr:negative elongation factor E [Chelonus insularis]
MVYLHFPSNLTEEELMLQTKYNKLKRKKKALQDLKTPKPEPERMPQAPKRPTEARDAREVAKKLIKSGVITAPKTPKRPEQSFKRPRGLERKLNTTEKTVCSYQPFSATQPEEEESDTTARPRVKDLYDSFVSAQSKDDRGTVSDKQTTLKTESRPRAGNTIFVSGYKISEDFLKKHFQSFGNILNISMEAEKNRGFVTFDKPEAAERAISEMDGSMVSSIQLKVSLARRQPIIDPINDTTSSSMWSSIAANYSQKSAHKDGRDMKIYEEDLFQ